MGQSGLLLYHLVKEIGLTPGWLESLDVKDLQELLHLLDEGENDKAIGKLLNLAGIEEKT